MNSRHTRTVQAIFTDPPPPGIAWSAVVSLLQAQGCSLSNARRGSGRKFSRDGLVLHLHEPHPETTLKRYAVLEVRRYLLLLGVTP